MNSDYTTIKVSKATHQLLRQLAGDGTLEALIARLVRREKQRQIGVSLAEHPLSAEDHAWLDFSASQMGQILNDNTLAGAA